MAFLVIAPGSPANAHAVDEVGPSHLRTSLPYEELVAGAGFADVTVTDVTPGYRATVAAWHREVEREADALRPLMGEEDYAERREMRLSALAAIDDGLLRRLLVTATRP